MKRHSHPRRPAEGNLSARKSPPAASGGASGEPPDETPEDEPEDATEGSLEGFAAWLFHRGRSAKTIEAYAYQVRTALAGRSMLRVMRDGTKAPKTRRQASAALRAWCRYLRSQVPAMADEAAQLLAQVDDYQLPPADRVAIRKPLDASDWKLLRSTIERADAPATWKAALLIIAARGLRVGDVLRMSRDDIETALETGRLRFVAKGNKILDFSAAPVADYLKTILRTKWGDAANVMELIAESGARGHRRSAYSTAHKRLTTLLKDAGERAGIEREELHLHRLRRTVTVEALMSLKGDPMANKKVQLFMGWRSINTVNEYTDFVEREAIDELDKVVKK
jgi:integrase